MGSWGPGIFSDDLAEDIRAQYRELLEDGVPDPEASERIIDEYEGLDGDEAHILWLALAATQASSGRLEEPVKQRALEIIDGDIGLELWIQRGPAEVAKRKAALDELRQTLSGPQKARSKIRKAWAHVTDLAPGDVMAYKAPNGLHILFRVARLEASRLGTVPVLRRLDWDRDDLPSDQQLLQLHTSDEPAMRFREPPVTWNVARHRRKDPDWRDVGFVLVGRVETAGDDASADVRAFAHWGGVQETLDLSNVASD